MLTASAHAQTSAPSTRAVKQTRSADDKTPLALFPVANIWTLPLNSALTAPPAFRDAFAVFALEGGQLAAYDLAAGSRAWLVSASTKVEPVIGAEAVFIAEEDEIAALSRRGGDVVWRQAFEAELAVAPIVDGDRLIVATADGDVIAFRAVDGREIWRRHLSRAASSRPAVTPTRLFVATADKQVVALDVDTGTIVWTRSLSGIGHDILALNDRMFLGSQDRFFYCLRVTDGEIEWRWPTGADAIGLPTADDRAVYFVSLDNVLRGLNQSNGVQQWKGPLSFRPISGPLKWSETLVVAGTTPLLQAFSVRQGKPLGRYAVSSELSAPPYLFTDPKLVFPVLVTISSDIVGRATVTAATRDIEPEAAAMVPLPEVVALSPAPNPPADLGEVSPLPNLTRVDPTAEP